jgi:hypothetical protein
MQAYRNSPVAPEVHLEPKRDRWSWFFVLAALVQAIGVFMFIHQTKLSCDNKGHCQAHDSYVFGLFKKSVSFDLSKQSLQHQDGKGGGLVVLDDDRVLFKSKMSATESDVFVDAARSHRSAEHYVQYKFIPIFVAFSLAAVARILNKRLRVSILPQAQLLIVQRNRWFSTRKDEVPLSQLRSIEATEVPVPNQQPQQKIEVRLVDGSCVALSDDVAVFNNRQAALDLAEWHERLKSALDAAGHRGPIA